MCAPWRDALELLARNARARRIQALKPGNIQRRDQCKIALAASPRYQISTTCKEAAPIERLLCVWSFEFE